jgi:hypothetical protein
MTLIITTLAKNKVVQASDRRLTRLDGTLHNDRANKAICVECNNAVFSVAYTGIARIGKKRTDEWIADYFDSIPDMARKPIHAIRRELTDYASAAFALYRRPLFLGVVLAGFHLYLERPFVISIFNADLRRTPTTIVSETPGNIFRSKAFVMEQAVNKRSATSVQLDGLSAVAHPRTEFGRIMQKRLRKTAKYAAYMDNYEVADNLVSAIRLAQHHPLLGHAIGSDVMVLIHDITDPAHHFSEARYYALGSSAEGYAPHVFGPFGKQRGTSYHGVVPPGGIWLEKPA